MADNIHLNDVGTEFRVTILDEDNVAVDVSAASTLSLIFKKPSGTSSTKTATLVNDGTDGLIKYVTESGDLDEIGTWKIQAYFVSLNGSWKSNFKSFKVHRNL